MPHSVSAPVPDAFSLEYIAEQHLLVARWLQPMELADLKQSYEAILEAALANGNCRHWLLDVRRRPVGDATALEWFGQEFSPRLLNALGGPLFAAYFAMIDDLAARDHEGIQKSIAEGELGGTHYHYFNREGEALAWLASQP